MHAHPAHPDGGRHGGTRDARDPHARDPHARTADDGPANGHGQHDRTRPHPMRLARSRPAVPSQRPRRGGLPARAVVRLACLALAATACGGDDADPVAAEPTSAAEAPTPDAEATAPAAEEPAPDPTATGDPEPDPAPDPTAQRPAGELTPREPADPDEESGEAGPDDDLQAADADGTPQDPQPGTHAAGTLTVSAVRCDVQGATFVGGRASQAMPGVAVSGDHVYLTDAEGRTLRFEADTGAGCTLALDPTWGEEGVHTPQRAQSAVDVAASGRVVLSGSVFESEVVDAATGAAYTCDTTGEVAVSADGTTGIAFFPGSAIRQATFTDTGCTVEDPAPLAAALPFEAQTIQAGRLLDDGTLLAGGSLPGNEAVVAAFGADGTERWRAGEGADGDRRFGWVHGVAPCGPGVCTVDTNFRRLQVFDADGGWVTSADLTDLLGVERAWWEDVDGDEEGRLWMPVGASRPDGDLADGFLFLVTFDGG